MFRKFVFTISLVALLLSVGQNALSAPSATILLTAAIGSTTPPLAPTGLTAQAGDAIVDLSWNTNSEPGIDGYNLYRSQVQGGPYTKINSVIITNTNYQDTGLTNGSTYYYVITAVDSQAEESNYSTETAVTLDVWIQFTSGGSNAFSPNGDGAYDEFTFSYYLNRDSFVTIEMFDPVSTLVRILKNNVAESIGTQTAAWDGKDNLGAVLADGEYLCIVHLEDGQGAQAEIQGPITIDNHFMRITEPSDGTVFNIGENFTFRARPSLYISNAANVYFEYSVQGSGTWGSAGQATQQADGSWAMNGNSGQSTPVDVLFDMRVVADYTDLNGQVRTEQSDAAITVSFTNDFNIFNYSDAPDAFSPNNNGNFDSVTIGYTINSDASMSVRLYDSSDILIRVLKDNISETAGAHTVVWDGRDDGGELLPEGIYNYKITGDDGLGNQRLKEGTITIDNNFMSFTEPVPGSTLNGTITIKAIVSANTHDESNVLFYSREKGVEVNWNAIDDDNPPVKQPDGSWMQTVDTLEGALNTVYEFMIGADYIDLNNQARTDYTIPVEYTVENEIVISNINDDPDGFSPNGDGEFDQTDIRYRINVSASVTVKVYDQNDIIVRTLKENVSEIAGDNTAIWDGMDDGAVLMPDGIYTYKIDAQDSEQNPAQQRIGTVALDNHFMSITSPISGAELTGQVQFIAVPSLYITGESNVVFSYRLKGSGTWTNTPGIAVKQPDDSWLLIEDVDLLVVGDYEVRVFAQYNDMNADQRGEYTLPVDYTIPNYVRITNVSDAPDAFSPNNDGDFDVNTLTYDINRDSIVNVRVYDANNNLVRTLKDSVSETFGAQTAVWDGRNDQGVFVADGTYYYLIEATDADSYQSQYQTSVAVNNNIVVFDPVDGSSINAQTTIKISQSPYISIDGVTFYYRLSGDIYWDYLGYGIRQADDSWTVSWDTIELENNDYEVYVRVGFYDMDDEWRQENTSPVTYSLTNPINIFNVSDTPDAFSPNGDEVRDISTISYKIVNNDGTVNIKIYDATSTIVRTLKSGVLETVGDQSAVWDGKDEQGNMLTDGTYTYVIEAVDSASNAAQVQGTTTIDNHPLTVLPADESIIAGIVNISAMPSSYTNNVRYVYFYVKHQKLSQYYENIGQGLQQPDGSWTTNLDTSEFIDGVYEFRSTLYYSDQEGNSRQDVVYSYYKVANGNLIVDVSDSPDPISPNADNRYDQTLIRYTLGIESDVSIYILDENSNNVRTVQNNEHLDPWYQYILWDGMDDNGDAVEDGNYTYTIHAIHEAGHEETEQGLISVDTQFASIVTPAADSSLNGVITFKIEPSPYVASVSSVEVYLDRTRLGYALQLPDETWELVWNTESMSDGNYKFKLYVTYIDSEGKARQEYSPEAEYTIANNLQVSRNAFSPNNDNCYDTTTIYYNAASNGEVNIKIYDSSGVLARTLRENVVITAGKNNAAWDGKDDAGNVVIDGIYTYKIDISYLNFSTKHQEGAVTVDNHFLNITSPSSGSTISQTQMFNIAKSAYVSEESTVSAYYRKVGSSEWTRLGDSATRYLGGGLWIMDWNTEDVGNGDYEICLSAQYEDLNGFTRNEYTTPKIYQVVNDFAITKISDSPDAFSPNGDGDYELTAITYFINSEAAVSIAVYDSNNDLIRNIEENVSKQAGENSVTWDGKDDNGFVAADGTYTYVIDANDGQGHAAQKQGTISIDNHFMSISKPIDGSTIGQTVTLTAIPSEFVNSVSSVRFYYRKGGTTNWGDIDAANEQVDGSWSLDWDTTDITNGDYELRVIAKYTDLNGIFRGEYSLPIRFSTDNVSIISFSSGLECFSPDNDGVKDEVDFTAVFTAAFDWQLNIKDSSNLTVKSFSGNGSIVSQSWDGQDSAGSLLPDGVYTVSLEIYDGQGVVGDEKSLQVIVDNTAPTAVITNPSDGQTLNNAVSVEGTAADLSLKEFILSYGAGENPISWTTIFTGTVAKTNEKLYDWDTSSLPDNSYTLKLTAEDNAGNISEFSVSINLSNIHISNVSVNPAAFDPSQQNTNISFELDKECLLTVNIYDEESKMIVRNLVNDQEYVSGSYNVEWNGKNDRGDIVFAEAYYFTIYAQGNNSAIAEYNDAVNPVYGSTPTSSNAVITPADFNPYKNELAEVHYDMSDIGRMRIVIRGTGVNNDRVLCDYEPRLSGHNIEIWDGRNDNGDIINGTYEVYFDVHKALPRDSIIVKNSSSFDVINFKTEAYQIIPSNSQISTIYYELTANSVVTMEIYDPNGNYFTTLKSHETQDMGINSVEWDGTNDNGDLCSIEGDYRVKITAADPNSTYTIIKTATIYVDKN